MYFADLVANTGVVQNALGSGCLTGVNVRHDADVARKRKVSFCHDAYRLEAEVRECLVGFGHLVDVHTLFNRSAFFF